MPEHLLVRPPGRRLDFVIAAALGVTQALFAAPLFAGSFTRWRQSIEAAYMADARFIAERFPDLSWNPLWYLGFPFELSYTPLVPALVAALAKFGGDVGAAYRLVAGGGFALGVVGLYALARALDLPRAAAVLAAALFAFAPSASFVLPGMRDDVASFAGAPIPWRLAVLVEYGEGPHVLGLSLALFATAALARYLASGRGYWTATLLYVAVALTNLIALLGAVVLALGTMAASAAMSRGMRVGAGAALLALAWYTPSFVIAVGGFSSGGGRGAYLLFPVLLIGATTVARVTRSAVAFWCVTFAGVVLGENLFRLDLAPQPGRYAIELDAAVALGVAAVAQHLLARVAWRGRALAAASVIVVAVAVPAWLAVQPRIAPDAAWRGWSEREVALWLRDHLAPGERAYLSGSHAYWLDVFADVPQVRGGVDFAATDPWWARAVYQINSGSDPDTSLLWLRALAVRYAVVTGAESADAYRDFARPEMFEGRLTRAATVQGARIYALDRVHATPMLVARSADEPPRDALDRDALARYLARLDAGASVALHASGLSGWSGEVESASPSTLLLRVAHDAGWHAWLDGREVAAAADQVGLLALDVPAGRHEVRVEHRPRADRLPGLAGALAFLTLTAVRAAQSRRAQASISPT